MKHLGDITLIKGNEAPVVDCVIGGSPCQGLSLAGKREGLDDERSGLYMEQIRVTKEMREHDRINGRTGVDVRPRYMVWENVPGAFSTNGGQDFAAVLEEAIRVAEPQAPSVSVPEKGWPTAGCIIDELGKWSVAWRVMDAQFWGVPQRRRRICLVCDFNGLNAPKIVFGEAEHHRSTERDCGDSSVRHTGAEPRPQVQPLSQGLPGHPDESQPQGEEVAGDVRDGIDGSGGAVAFGISPYHSNCMKSDNPNSGYYEADTARSLDAQMRYPACNQGGMAVVQPTVCIEGNGSRPSHKGDGYIESDTMYTLNTIERHGVAYSVENPLCIEMTSTKNTIIEDGICPTLTARMGTGGNQVNAVLEPVGYEMQAFGKYKDSGMASSLKARDYKDATDLVVTGVDAHYVDTSHADDVVRVDDVSAPLQARDYKGGKLVQVRHIVRRLTPLECERLQGFPDGWTDIGEWVDTKGKKHKEADSPRYRALGNSIAIPPWKWILKRLCACYERDATMASLFDGIGGFPYIWEQLNGKGSCLWASEIEEFPIAVTKLRFGGNN